MRSIEAGSQTNFEAAQAATQPIEQVKTPFSEPAFLADAPQAVIAPTYPKLLRKPLIAAGGIATGRQMLAAMVMGAEAVQMGSRFIASEEASSHIAFKNAVIESQEGDTILTMKQLTPVRLMRNKFYEQVQAAERNGATVGELRIMLGRGRAKKGMFEGSLEEGELEIGQVSSLLDDIIPAGGIVKKVWQEFMDGLQNPVRIL